MAEHLPDDGKVYRVHVLDSDGHLKSAECVGFRGDAEAIAYGRAILDTEALEVWEGARFVERLEPRKANTLVAPQ
jgi:hypothetical protein